MNIAIAALSGLASSIFLGWWLYDVDWRLGTAFVTALVTVFLVSWNEQE